MPKTANAAQSSALRLTLSDQSVRMLRELAERGIYGRNPAEVAGRFVDQALQGFIEPPRLELPSRGASRRGK